MKLPRNISGEDLAAGLCKQWNYCRVHQAGSHIILETDHPLHQRIAVPAHKELRIGTLNSILRAVAEAKQTTRQAILESLEL
jgi:predicted RNA binding protein YcfA (HicA-like mRNA interferase family)